MTTRPVEPPNFQTIATVIVSSMLFLSAVAVLWEFIPALLWSGVLAIALWSLYARVARWREGVGWERFGCPLLFTLVVGLFLAVPLTLGAVELSHVVQTIAHWAMKARRDGAPVPEALAHLPYAGAAIAAWWQENLADPDSAADLIGRIQLGQFLGWSRTLGGHLVHDFITFLVTLLALFFLFREGDALRARFSTFVRRVFGERGQMMTGHAIAAIHGTVIGLVLVGLGEGALIGIGYWLGGVPHALFFALATGILAIIPMGAPLAFGLASLLLYIGGHSTAALGVLGFGFVVLMLADYVVRPALIGSAAKLPFFFVLVGTIGGLSSLGLIGLFVGPVLMAVLVALWRDLSQTAPIGERAP